MGCTSSKKPNKISTELTSKQISTLKAHTKLSEDEILEWHAAFLHECPNGNLDRKRFVDVYKQFYQQDKPDSFCNYAFSVFDANNDGTIDFEEFLLTVAPTSQADIDNQLEVAFEIYDVSGDDQLDRTELANLISAMCDLVDETDRDPQKCADEIIARLDTNGDKKLSKQDFINGCRSNPDILRMIAPNI